MPVQVRAPRDRSWVVASPFLGISGSEAGRPAGGPQENIRCQRNVRRRPESRRVSGSRIATAALKSYRI
jgi:hypothetical protein